MDTPDPLTQAAAAAMELRAAGERFVALCGELHEAAAELAALDARYNAAITAAELPRAGAPPARELATEVVLAACSPLRPFVAFVSEESARRSAAALSRFGRRAVTGAKAETPIPEGDPHA